MGKADGYWNCEQCQTKIGAYLRTGATFGVGIFRQNGREERRPVPLIRHCHECGARVILRGLALPPDPTPEDTATELAEWQAVHTLMREPADKVLHAGNGPLPNRLWRHEHPVVQQRRIRNRHRWDHTLAYVEPDLRGQLMHEDIRSDDMEALLADESSSMVE